MSFEVSLVRPGRVQFLEKSESIVSSARIESERAGELLDKLKECGRSRDLSRVREVHAEAREAGGGVISHLYIANSLIDVYGECGRMELARSVFDGMLQRDLVSWNALLQGYARNGQSLRMLEAFHSMSNCISPDARTYVVVLSTCGTMAMKSQGSCRRRWLEQAKMIHALVICGDCGNIYVENTLIHVYAKFGQMLEARLVLDSMKQPDTVSWNALLQGYVENGESEIALELFEGVLEPNSRTFIAALLACASSASEEMKAGNLERGRKWLEQGKRIHTRALERKLCTLFVESVLVDMYSKCGSMSEARDVFEKMAKRDVVSWTCLMQGYVENGEAELALEIFDRAGEYGCVPNSRSFTVALSACAALAGVETGKSSGRWLEKGRRIHSRAVQTRCSNMFVESSLVDLLSKSRAMSEARAIFDGMRERDSVAWNALIMGYVSNGENELALRIVSAMSVPKNSSTYVAALVACTNLMAVDSGRSLHEEVKSVGLEKDLMVSNCLVEFYGKCGDIRLAKEVFDGMPRRTVVSWTSLMSAYGLQGDTGQVFELFRRMKEVDGVSPCGITFVCVLSACSHAGLTEKGREVFESMEKRFGVSPGIKHYTCLVDLYCRANSLDEALRIVRTMPFEADYVTWKAILGACHKWGNVAAGEAAFRALLELRKKEDDDDVVDDEDDASVYVLMGGIYKKAGMNRECAEVVFTSEKIQQQQLQQRMKKNTTMWTDAQNKVHKFISKA